MSNDGSKSVILQSQFFIEKEMGSTGFDSKSN